MAQVYGTSSGLTAVLAGPFGSVGASGKLTQLVLPADGWKNAESPYFQEAAIDGISANSMVCIQADREQLRLLAQLGTAIHIDNEDGTAMAYAVGSKPDTELTFQVSLTEVVAQ